MTTEKSQQKTTKTVPPPRLRFKQFEGQGEWEEKRLREVCEINPGGERIPASFIYIDLEAVSDGKLHCERVVQRNDAPSRAQRVLKSGDIIFQTVRPYQKNNLFFEAVNDEYRYVASTGYAQLRARGSKKFLYYSVLEDGFVERVIAKCTGSNYPAINSSDLSDITLFTTSLPEQQHIAACLSSLDDLITAHTDKLEALRQHKRGLMQGLFPAEGERVPQLRFPEFAEAGDWEEKKLGELLISRPDYGVNAPAVPFSDDLPTYLRITDISEDGKFLQDAKVSVSGKITKEYYLNPGDIVLARTGASVGKSYLYDSEDGPLVFAGFLIRVRPNTRILNSVFLANYLTTQKYWEWVSSNSARSGQPGINSNEYASLVIPLPSISEQQRIAAALSSLDDIITFQGKRLAAIREFKRGLMQGLFPGGHGK